MKETWQIDLETALESCAMRISSVEDIYQPMLAALVVRILETLDHPQAFMLVKPSVLEWKRQQPDLLLYHPNWAFFTFSLRDFQADDLHSDPEGSLSFRRAGYAQSINLTEELNSLGVDVEALIKKQLQRRGDMPSVHSVLVLTHVGHSNLSLDDPSILLAETLESSYHFKQAITRFQPFIRSPRMQDAALSKIRRTFGDNAVINDLRAVRPQLASETLGYYIDQAHSEAKFLSDEQQQLSRVDARGAPRLFRGVAGSGKSVVLANIVARYLQRQRELPLDSEVEQSRRAAVVCFNRALVPMLRDKIEITYQRSNPEAKLPDHLEITHFNGLFYRLGQEGLLTYICIKTSIEDEERARQYLEQITDMQRSDPARYERLLYDAIFVDEGQDLSELDYQVLLAMLRPDTRTGQKTLVIFYDDAQNLYARPRPNWKQIGIDLTGRSRVMRECHRNTRPIVELAFNVLLGTRAQRPTEVKTRSFADVAALKQDRLVEERADGYFDVHFTKREGPAPYVRIFDSYQQETEFLLKELDRLINQQQVRPEDILVLGRHTETVKGLADFLRDRLRGFKGFVLPFGNSQDRDRYIFRPEHLTLSTVHGAKGYDAHVVFVIASEQFADREQERAMFYVAATRAKNVLYILGSSARQDSAEAPLLYEAHRIAQQLKAARAKKGQAAGQ